MPLTDLRELGHGQYLGTWVIDESIEQLREEIELEFEEENGDIKHEVKLKEWYATRILCRKVVEYAGMEYEGVKKDEFGKPWLKHSTNFISVTHCFPYVCVILDTNREVGIDLERSRKQISRVAPKFMSELEYNHSKDPNYQLINWAAKEALYKLHGRKSLELSSQLIIEPFEPGEEGTLEGTILDGGEEKHQLYYRFFRDGEYVLVYSLN